MARQIREIHDAMFSSSENADKPGFFERLRNQEALGATAKRLFWFVVLGLLAVFGTAIAALVVHTS